MKNQFVTEQGFLTPDAKKYVEETFGKETDTILNIAENEADLKLLGSLLSSIVWNKILNKTVNLT